MAKTKSHRRVRFWVLLVLAAVLLTATAIFLFSSESGTESSNTSGIFSRALLRIIRPDLKSLPKAEQHAILVRTQHVVRKCAHFLEFSVLGFFLRLFFYGVHLRHAVAFPLTLALGAVYAALDEYHQYLVGTRTASGWDVVLDSAGVLFGLFIATLIVVHRDKKKRQEQAG